MALNCIAAPLQGSGAAVRRVIYCAGAGLFLFALAAVVLLESGRWR